MNELDNGKGGKSAFDFCCWEEVKISPMCKVNASSRKSGVWIPNQSPIRGLRLLNQNLLNKLARSRM